jgi:hypothetical protein
VSCTQLPAGENRLIDSPYFSAVNPALISGWKATFPAPAPSVCRRVQADPVTGGYSVMPPVVPSTSALVINPDSVDVKHPEYLYVLVALSRLPDLFEGKNQYYAAQRLGYPDEMGPVSFREYLIQYVSASSRWRFRDSIGGVVEETFLSNVSHAEYPWQTSWPSFVLEPSPERFLNLSRELLDSDVNNRILLL